LQRLIPLIGLIADDFTGAMDSGAQFVRIGLPTRLRLTGQGSGPVEIINTASRELAESEAVGRCRQAVRSLAGRVLFKKIDSTLRGHVGAEIEAVLQGSDYRKAVVCPAAPRQGRVVRGGQVFVEGCLLADSPFKDDPTYPATTSQLTRLIRRPAVHLDLAVVRQPAAGLERAITAIPEAIVTADAETPADLANLSRAIIAGGYLPCGAFGLAQAWVQELCGQRTPLTPPLFPRGQAAALAVVGSGHVQSHRQVEAFARLGEDLLWSIPTHLSTAQEQALLEKLAAAWPEQGARVIWPDQMDVSEDQTWQEIIDRLSRFAANLLQRISPAFLVIVGGETATSLCTLLQVQAVDLLGEIAPGIPWGRLIGGRLDGIPVITKAGGFGEQDTLVKILLPDAGEG
jgi:D-threonate/D-erythronate kinase